MYLEHFYMKIDNTYTNYDLEKISPKAGKPVMATPESPSESGSPDKQGAPRDAIVNLSQASKEASLMENAIAEAPDIRQDKVLALKEKIATGQYELNPQAIADKMVDHFTNDLMNF